MLDDKMFWFKSVNIRMGIHHKWFKRSLTIYHIFLRCFILLKYFYIEKRTKVGHSANQNKDEINEIVCKTRNRCIKISNDLLHKLVGNTDIWLGSIRICISFQKFIKRGCIAHVDRQILKIITISKINKPLIFFIFQIAQLIITSAKH